MLAHQVFKLAEGILEKLMSVNGHRIDSFNWNGNDCQVNCNRCSVKGFLCLKIARGNSEINLYLGKGTRYNSLGTTDHNDSRKLASIRINDFICDKIINLI